MAVDVSKVLSAAFQIATDLAAAYEGFQSGGTVTIPPVRTYIGQQHVEIDLTIKHLPPP